MDSKEYQINNWQETIQDSIMALQAFNDYLDICKTSPTTQTDFFHYLRVLCDACLESWFDEGPIDELAESLGID